MNSLSITQQRLLNQNISNPTKQTPQEIVSWMGAMQAQDFAMSKWAIGIRLPNSTEQSIEDSISKGDIIRTHLLRPTWHLVSASDIYWMLILTAPNIKKNMKSRDKELELTESIYNKTNSIIENSLQNGNHLTREEIIQKIKEQNIPTNENRASHILMKAELEGLICSGKIQNKKQTYTLLAERGINKIDITKEEALAKLTQRYFQSHSPATIEDYTWWSGLSVKEAKTGLESIKSELKSLSIENKTYWFKELNNQPKSDNVYLLPAFDEYIISYKDRTAMLTSDDFKKAISSNGIFRPTIVCDGKVIGLWKKNIKKNTVAIETDLFQQINSQTKEKLQESIQTYTNFLPSN